MSGSNKQIANCEVAEANASKSPDVPQSILKEYTIRLPDAVYQGSIPLMSQMFGDDYLWARDFMRELAEQVFLAYKNADIVTVWEHAGWYVGYAVDEDGKLQVIKSANDRAVFPDHLQEIRDRLFQREWNVIELGVAEIKVELVLPTGS